VRYTSIVIALLFVVLAASTALAAGPFTGSWQAEIGLSPQQTKPFSSFYSTLNAGLHVGFATLSSTSDFVFSGWLWQSFGLSASLGFVNFTGGLLFEPQSGSFLYAHGKLEFNFYPVSIRLYSAMTGAQSSYGLTYGHVFDVYGELLGGDISMESATFFGADLSGITFTQTASDTDSTLLKRTYTVDPTLDGTCFCFSGEEFTLKAHLFSCIDLTSTTTFGKTGFSSQEFELSFLHLFGAPLNLTLDYAFTLQTASHSFTPSLETDFGCLKFYTNILGSGGMITGLEIYGVEFQASFAGATFTSISNLNTADYVITTPDYGSIVELKSDAIANGHLYYSQQYWEIASLSVKAPGAGGMFTFSTTTFFGTSTGLLFDWGQSEMGVKLSLGSTFSISTSIIVNTTGFSEWKVGMGVNW
jgi:hypothetical protein